MDQVLCKDTSPSNVKLVHELNQTSTPEGLAKDNTEPAKHKNKRLLIIGDEQLKGLAWSLSSTRSGKWNDVYRPYAEIITGGTSTEILEKCANISTQLTRQDIVILGCGSNDNDIHKLHSNICIAISKLNKATVLLAPIKSNPYLNEKKLNYNLKLWTKHFANCNFIDIDVLYSRNNCDMDYITLLCSKVNIWIDYRQYEHEFLSINSLKNIYGFTLHRI